MTRCLLQFLLVLGIAAAAQATTLQNARDFIARADSLRDQGAAVQALGEADSMLAEAAELHVVAVLQRTRGLILATQGKFEEAELSYREGLRAVETTDDRELLHELRLKLAWVLDRRSDTAAADSLAELVRVEAEQDGLGAAAAQAQLQIGRRHLLSGRFDDAALELQAAIDFFDESDNLRSAGDAHNLMGIVRANLLQLDEAIDEFDRTRAIAEASDNTGLLARSLNNLGWLNFQLGDPNESAKSFRSAYELQRSLGSVPNQLLSGLNVAEAEMRLGNLEQADELLLTLLAQAREHDQVPYEIGALTNLGENDLRRDLPHKALQHHREAQRLASQLDEPLERLRALLGEARGLAALDSNEAALARLDSETPALRTRVPGAWALQLDNDRARYLGDLDRFDEALAIHREILATAVANDLAQFVMGAKVSIADCHRALAATDSALHWYRLARDQWESHRQIPLDPKWRERRASQARGLHLELALLELDHGAQTEQERVALAYDTLQRYKSRTLLERVQSPGRELEAATPIRLASLQADVLKADERLLDFHAGGRESLLFLIEREQVQVRRLPAEHELSERLELAKSLLANPQAQSATLDEVFDRLRSDIFGDWMTPTPGRERLLFSPDGPLHQLPVAALRTEGVGIIDRWELLRIPSASLLASLRARPLFSHSSERSVLAIIGANEAEDDLPAARREVHRLGRDFAGVTTLWAGATAAALDDASLGDHAIVHFAGHALVRDDNPWRSGLVLSGFGSTSQRAAPGHEMKLLRADRIAQMRLDSDMVFLAACESAGGEMIAGEGVLGLTSAFLSAGAHSVIATLWPVEDEAASVVVGHFYDALSAGATVGNALALAQRRARSDRRTAHPRHWAGYVVIGDGSQTLQLARKPRFPGDPLPLAAVASVALLLTGAWLFRRSRASL